MSYDVDALRSRFPALETGTAFFDGPGGTQFPREVADAMSAALLGGLSNRGTRTATERRSEDIVAEARSAIADLVGADARGVVFGRSMTQLTYDLSRTLAKAWSSADEIVVSRLDHDSNIRPWIHAAAAAGATVRWAEFDPDTGELTPDAVAAACSERTRLVAVTAASNLIGTRPDIPAIAERVHAAGALLYVDGVHATAHVPTDVAALGADFYGCSPYKFLGPHCGTVVADPALLEELRPDKLAPSTDAVPERFELGTLPYELMAGTTAAIDVLASLGAGETRRERLLTGMAAIDAHEEPLRERLEAGLNDLGVTVFSRAARRTPTLLFTLPEIADTAVADHLASRTINAPAGSFYALECSRTLGLGDTGAVRVGLAPYSNEEDVARLLAALAELRG